MRQGKCSNMRRLFLVPRSPDFIAAGAVIALLCLPAFGQRTSGAAPAGHVGAAGSMTRPVAGPSGGARPSGTTRPVGTPGRSGQNNRMVRTNNVGVSRAVPQSTWERPKNPPPQWATPKNPPPQWATPYTNRQSNRTSGNIGYRRHRDGRRYLPAYGVGYVGIPYYGYGDSTAFFDGDAGNDTAQQSQPSGPDGPARADYAPEDPCGEAGCPPDGPFYPPQEGYRPQEPQRQPSAVDSAAAQSNGLDHPEVTLVFNDGRPPKKVRSYALTSSAVFVSENGHQTEIPIADLDMQATVAQNRNAGVDFTLPGGSR